MRSPRDAEGAASARLGVVVPIKAIDAAAIEILAANARAAAELEFIAVGKLVSGDPEPLPNLAIVDFEGGLYEAMNAGLAQAMSDYLLFMGIDDRLLAQNVPQAIEQLAGAPRSPLIALPYVFNHREYRLKPVGTSRSAFHHQGVLFDRLTALRLGGYATQYRLHADLDLMFRMQAGETAAWIGVPLVEFRTGGLTTSGESSLESIREINRIYRLHGVSRLDRMFFFSVVNLTFYGLRYLLQPRSRPPG